MKRTPFFGYNDCEQLRVKNITATLTPHGGGRILEFSLDGENIIYLDPNQSGWTYTSDETVDPCGGRFDIGPEKLIPQHNSLWLKTWKLIESNSKKIIFESPLDKKLNIRLTRTFEFSSNQKFKITQKVFNEAPHEIELNHWSRTLVKPGGVHLFPLNPQSRYPKKWIAFGPGNLINYSPSYAHFFSESNTLVIPGKPPYFKIGSDAIHGWNIYILPSQLCFIKEFKIFPKLPYKELVHMTNAIYFGDGTFNEIEPHGPSIKLGPKQNTSFSELWSLTRLPKEIMPPFNKKSLQQLRKYITNRNINIHF